MGKGLLVNVWLEMNGTETMSQLIYLSPDEPATIAFGDLLPGLVQVVIEPEPKDEEVTKQE